MPDEPLEPEPFNYIRILATINDRPWAITQSSLQAILNTVQHPIHNEVDIEAVAAKIGKPLENTGNRVETRNGTAVVGVVGPLFRYGNVLTRVSGATSIQMLSYDLQTAMDDPTVSRIIMDVNSPGGQVDGISELADRISAYNDTKPITAYVGGQAASGAYWLASAAGRIVADESSELGSIGVLATFIDNREAQRRQGISQMDIVSSQSPLKRADPATDEGRAQLQARVDELAQLFIERVARFRGLSAAKVARDFGRGGIMSARAAITVGMADSLGSLEGLIEFGGSQRRRGVVPVTGPSVPETNQPVAAAPFDPGELEQGTEDVELNPQNDCTDDPGQCGDDEDQENEKEGMDPDMQTEADRQRIAAILNCEEARGRDELAKALALDTKHTYTLEEAQTLLKTVPVATTLDAKMTQLGNPKVGTGERPEEDNSTSAEVRRILAFVPNERKHAAYRQ